MKRTKIEKAALKAKSEELKIPFSNLLAGFVLEELMYLITDSVFSETLILKNETVFGLDQYRNKNVLTLKFAYLLKDDVIKSGEFKPGQAVSLKLAYLMLARFLDKEKIPEIKWRGKTSIEKDRIDMKINGEFEEMTVPIRILIDPIPDLEMSLERGTLYPFMRNDAVIRYLRYPWELALSESLYLILKDMELIPEMSIYDSVYRILHKELVDGRHIQEQILLYCKRDRIELQEERIDEILSYRDYPYMRKRWDKYKKRSGGNKPAWEEVLNTIKSFLPSVWRAICRDEIFFGDWMPELGRFL